MNELLDKILIRLLFTVFVCLVIYVYQHIHVKRYSFFSFISLSRKPVGGASLGENPAEMLYFFSKILGIGIAFSGLAVDLEDGMAFAILDIFLYAFLACIFYTMSLYILDGIILYNFEYEDEIIKKKNFAYALIYFAHCLCTAVLIERLLSIIQNSMVMLLFLWLFTMVLLGIAAKSFSLLSKFSLDNFLIQMNLGVSLSYLGRLLGWTILITWAVNHPLIDVEWYIVEALWKLSLSLVVLPVFIKALTIICKVRHAFKDDSVGGGANLLHLGYGIYEGFLFLIGCYLTVLVTENVRFGSLYDV